MGATYANVRTEIVNLTSTFDRFEEIMGNYSSELAFANSRSRLRMMALYQIAQSCSGIVVGTGNKIEDFGVGFFILPLPQSLDWFKYGFMSVAIVLTITSAYDYLRSWYTKR